MAEYYVVRDKNTGLYFRGKGANRWGKYYNQASIYRIKANAENTIKEVSWRGEQAEIVPIQIVETTADVAPKSEVERLEKELDSKQFRCDSCDRIMLTGAEHRYCVKQAKAEVAREIFEEIEKEIDSVRGLNFAMQSLDHFIAELKKKYTGYKV